MAWNNTVIAASSFILDTPITRADLDLEDQELYALLATKKRDPYTHWTGRELHFEIYSLAELLWETNHEPFND